MRSILRAQTVASARTLEQKISDAGPNNQRIDPHILTPVRNALVRRGEIIRTEHGGAPWFHLKETPPGLVQARLAELLPIHRRLSLSGFTKRLGQTLEIAVYRALSAQKQLEFLGSFPDLTLHDDSQPYAKEEPPSTVSGRSIAPKRLDYLVVHPEAGWAGIEVKNVREWLYPDRDELHDFLAKCLTLDSVPVLIARRFPFVTFHVLSTCGVLFHQTYNQLFPSADADLADAARAKNSLGFHDIRVGNAPDTRLLKFVTKNLPALLPPARTVFHGYRDLLAEYVGRRMKWKEFAARVRRRREGKPEDRDEELEQPGDPYDYT